MSNGPKEKPVAQPTKHAWKKDDAASLLEEHLDANLPAVVSGTKAVATTAPVKDIFVDEAMASERDGMMLPADRPRAPQASGQTGQKTIMHDMTSVRPAMSVGPIDELRGITLADFRRLHPVASNAG